MNPECVTCRHIEGCTTVTPEKVLAHYCCVQWEEVQNAAQVHARCDIINRYGVMGLKVLLRPAALPLEDPDMEE